MTSQVASKPSTSEETRAEEQGSRNPATDRKAPATQSELWREDNQRLGPAGQSAADGQGSLAKVLLPRRRNDVLTRPRLLNRLYDLVDRKLILISAAAGYGKTTLLVDFAHDLEHPVCWYALDRDDRDPRTFLEHLVLSLHHRFPAFGERTRQALACSPDLSGGAPGVVNVLVAEVQDVIPRWFVLVLDDYHQLGEAPEIGSILARCLSSQTGQFLLIIASRTIPALPSIVQLTAKGEVEGLGAEDLRFDASEIRELLAQNYRLHIPEREANVLATQSEGWITGILLTAHTMWRGILERLVHANTSDQPVYEYLAEEVFVQQAPAVQSFLTASAILQQMSPSLCEEALGLAGAAELLALLEERNLFIIRLEGEWYRYHRLFQEYLGSRLRKEQEERWIELHQRAAAWFERHEQPETAVHHCLTIGAYADAARIMTQAAPELFCSGRVATLMAWGAALPASVHERTPRLALFEARAAGVLGRREQALELTEVAERGYRAAGDTRGLAYILLERCELWQEQGRLLEALALGLEVLAMIEESGVPVHYEALRMLGRLSVALGKLDEGETYLRQSLAHCQSQGGEFEKASVESALADCLWRQGRWSDAISLQRQAADRSRRLNNPGALAGTLNDLGFYLYTTGEHKSALRYLEESLALARQSGFRRVEAFALISLSELRRDLGDLDGAVKRCEAGLLIADDLGEAFLAAYGREALGLAYLARGELQKARAAIEHALTRAELQHSEYQLGRYGASHGLALTLSGNAQAGFEALERARERLVQVGARRELARACFFTAVAYYQENRKSEALEAMQQALAASGPRVRGSAFAFRGLKGLALMEEALEAHLGGEDLAALVSGTRAFESRARAILKQASPLETGTLRPLRIFGFGTGRVERGGDEIPVSEWGAAATRYLLFYLLVNQPRSREQIAAVLWPELAAPKVKATFHTTKFRLKRALGCEPLQFDGRNYQIDPDFDYWFDVAEFERLLDEPAAGNRLKSLQQAIGLYGGDLLEDCYADWCEPYRETLRERYLEALNELAGLLVARRQYRRATQVLLQGLQLDNLREEFHRSLMQAYALSGRRGQAAAQYECCARALELELGAIPSPETTTLYRRIVEGQTLD